VGAGGETWITGLALLVAKKQVTRSSISVSVKGPPFARLQAGANFSTPAFAVVHYTILFEKDCAAIRVTLYLGDSSYWGALVIAEVLDDAQTVLGGILYFSGETPGRGASTICMVLLGCWLSRHYSSISAVMKSAAQSWSMGWACSSWW